MKGGMFRALFLLPKAMKSRNNPDKQQLRDVLPDDLYQRWLVLKQKYMGRDRSVEKRRPLVAGQMLQDEALDDAGLSNETRVGKVVRKAAKRHDVPLTRPKVTLKITDPKAALNEFANTSLDDIECFRLTLDRIETDIETLKLRANAWALGELEILRQLPATDNVRACTESVLQSQIAKRLGFDDLREQVESVWLDAAESALKRNASTFAVLPMGLVVSEDGFVAALAAKGYRVIAPDESSDANPDAEDTDPVDAASAEQTESAPNN
jgi:hypothetical protein